MIQCQKKKAWDDSTPGCTGNLVASPIPCTHKTNDDACKVRHSIVDNLEQAKRLAAEKGKNLQLFSGYRSEATYRSFWETDIEAGKSFSTVSRTRCSPNADGSFAHCPHYSGCAVDVTIGTPYEESTAERELIKQVMEKAGFKYYCEEYWHYESSGTIGYSQAGSSNCYKAYWRTSESSADIAQQYDAGGTVS